jgi:hypothetical protein
MIMEWIPPIFLLLGVLIVGVPVGLYFGAVGLLWVLSLGSGGSTRSRTRFQCPVTNKGVTADFLTGPGGDRPSDVLSCSTFGKPDDVRCQKACLDLAATYSVSTALLPRYSLIAGGTAYRVEAGGRHGGDGTPDGEVGRAA